VDQKGFGDPMPILSEDDKANFTVVVLPGLTVRQSGWLITGLQDVRRSYDRPDWEWGQEKVKEIDAMIREIHLCRAGQVATLRDCMTNNA
jgi:hypothetical protein